MLASARPSHRRIPRSYRWSFSGGTGIQRAGRQGVEGRARTGTGGQSRVGTVQQAVAALLPRVPHGLQMQVTHHDWRARASGPSSSGPRHHWARGETRRFRPAAPAETHSRCKRLQPPAEPPFPGAAPSPPSSACASRSHPPPPGHPLGQGRVRTAKSPACKSHCSAPSTRGGADLGPQPGHCRSQRPSPGPSLQKKHLQQPVCVCWGGGRVFTVRDRTIQEPRVKICPRGHQGAPLLLLR